LGDGQEWPKVKAALYITRESSVQVRVLLTYKLHIEKQTQLWYIKQQEYRENFVI
jgi:hypothetical protein